LVFVLSKYGSDHSAIGNLFITDYNLGDWDHSLPEIRHGELWRLFTPVFIHFSPMHILFNMMWLRDLGSMIEGRQSSLHLLLLTLVIAAGSNVAQVYLGHGPSFGGMSGVVYGLLGYIWIRGKFDPASGLYLHSSTVVMMMVWFALCFANLPLIGPVANAAHGAGLLIGVAWGYLSSLRYR
jgi:GlpG protein